MTDAKTHIRQCKQTVSSMRITVTVAHFRRTLNSEINRYSFTNRSSFQIRDRTGQILTPRARTITRYHNRHATTIQKFYRRQKMRYALKSSVLATIKYLPCRGKAYYNMNTVTIQKLVRGHVYRKFLKSWSKKLITDENIYGLSERYIYYKDKTRAETHAYLSHDYARKYRKLESEIQRLEQRRSTCIQELRDVRSVVEERAKATKLIDRLRKVYLTSVLIADNPVRVECRELQVFLPQELVRIEKGLAEAREQFDSLLKKHEWRHVCQTLIATRFRGYRIRLIYHFDEERELHEARVRRSLEAYLKRSYDQRMLRYYRQQLLSSVVVIGFFRIVQAKNLKISLRRNRAQTIIARFYRGRMAIYHAKLRLQRLRIEFIINTFIHGRSRLLRLQFYYRVWLNYCKNSLQLKRQQNLALLRGKEKWIYGNALAIQNITKSVLYHHRVRLGEALDKKLHPTLRLRLDEFYATGTHITFFSDLNADYRARAVANEHEGKIAKRYDIELPDIPVQGNRIWFDQLRRSGLNTEHALSRTRPLTKRMLLFLHTINEQYWQYTKYEEQLRLVHERQEEMALTKAYLVHLSLTNKFRYIDMKKLQQYQRKYYSLEVEISTRVAWQADEHLRPQQLSKLALESTSLCSRDSTKIDSVYAAYHSIEKDMCQECLALLVTIRTDMVPIVEPICRECGAPRAIRTNLSRVNMDRFPKVPSSFLFDGQILELLEPSDGIVMHAFFHTLAPVGHRNRLSPPHQVWAMAKQHARPYIEAMYSLELSTIDALLYDQEKHGRNNKKKRLQQVKLPPAVYRKLERILGILATEIASMK